MFTHSTLTNVLMVKVNYFRVTSLYKLSSAPRPPTVQFLVVYRVPKNKGGKLGSIYPLGDVINVHKCT